MIDPKQIKIEGEIHRRLKAFQASMAGELGFVPEFSPLLFALIEVGAAHKDDIAKVFEGEF